MKAITNNHSGVRSLHRELKKGGSAFDAAPGTCFAGNTRTHLCEDRVKLLQRQRELTLRRRQRIISTIMRVDGPMKKTVIVCANNFLHTTVIHNDVSAVFNPCCGRYGILKESSLQSVPRNKNKNLPRAATAMMGASNYTNEPGEQQGLFADHQEDFEDEAYRNVIMNGFDPSTGRGQSSPSRLQMPEEAKGRGRHRQVLSSPLFSESDSQPKSRREDNEQGRAATSEEEADADVMKHSTGSNGEHNLTKLIIDNNRFLATERNLNKIFLMTARPKDATSTKCYIKRNRRGKNTLFPEYSIFLKEGDQFLMTSKKRAKKKNSNYLISMEPGDHNPYSSSILGKLRANFIGTQFNIYDSGLSPNDSDFHDFGDDEYRKAVRSELGLILYESNIVRSNGPKKMHVCIGNVDENGNTIKKWQPFHKKDEMFSHFKRSFDDCAEQKDDLVVLVNKAAVWNEKMGAYSLDFGGHVATASVKNFQLVERNRPDGQENIILQFGRVGKNEFILDFKWPISPYQAFAIAVSSLDTKIASE